MKYTVYQTTNLVNGKVYVGIHATEDPNDWYLGSGKTLKAAIRKYGRASFRKEVLFVFESAEEMAAKEAEIVTREFVDRDDTYNLVPGGNQGDAWYEARKELVFSSEEQSLRGKKGVEVQRELLRTSPEYQDLRRQMGVRLCRLLHAEGRVPKGAFLGRKHSEGALQKMRSVKVGHGKGSENSQAGTAWVCKLGEKPKKISLGDLLAHLEKGWSQGRKVGPVHRRKLVAPQVESPR